MSDTILTDGPSADNCHMASTCNGILVERVSLYCISDMLGQHNKIGGITFRAALIYICNSRGENDVVSCKMKEMIVYSGK